VLKNIADLVSPYVAKMVNRWFFDGHYPSDFQQAFVTPIVKPGSDPADVWSYWSISNFYQCILSKLFERMVAQRISEYLQQFELLPVGQSRSRPGHSSETAITHVLSD
jgi:hypothetical protein